MNRRTWILAALVSMPLSIAGGLVYANSHTAETFICPVTGEPLPCEKCCPLNGVTKADQTEAKATLSQTKSDGSICPLTGDKLGCQGCCPLNDKK